MGVAACGRGFYQRRVTTTSATVSPTRSGPTADGAYRMRRYIIGVALFAVTLLLYLPSVRHDIVHYDDPGFVVQNDWVRHGLTWANVVRACFTTEMANWHPVTWLSYLLDVQVFGTAPAGFHLTNVLLHALNAVLVFVVLQRLTGSDWRSAFVAALFAFHPTHVESVAWIAERKDVLSTAFFLGTLWCYAEWRARRASAPRGASGWYWAALVVFALGLMAKPMLVTVPCVLLLLDYWPLRRWIFGKGAMSGAVRLIAEKVPFLVLSVVDSIITVKAQAGIGAVLGLNQMTFSERVINALVSYATYVGKCVFPSRLAVYYPYHGHTTGEVGVAVAVVLVLTAIAIVAARRRPYLLTGWLWFVGTLVPVIGFVQVGGQALADRYTYIPSIGLFVAITWLVRDWIVTFSQRVAVAAAAALLLIGSAVLSERQLAYWQNSGTLFHHALAVTEGNVPAHLGLGFFYSQQPGRLADAIREYREAVRLSPGVDDTHRGLAAVLARDPASQAEAIFEYREAVRLNPRYVPTLMALGVTAEKSPATQAVAIAAYEAAVRLEPANADAHNRLGNVLSNVPERRNDAIAEYRKALALHPDWVEVHLNLGATLASVPGHLAEAITEYETVLRAKPEFADAHNNLANALAHTPGRAADAVAEYEKAIQLRPDYVEARCNYAVLLGFSLGRKADAIAQLESVLRIRPDFQPARELLAQIQRSN